MTLQQAIKELTAAASDAWGRDKQHRADACQLGIEAIQRLQANRQHPEFDHYIPLPGETEDPHDD